MDKKALKLTIIELRENQNKSFAEIADILYKEYRVHMSRQAVCGMYNRSTSDKSLEHNKTLILATNDIANLYCLGLNNSEIKQAVVLKNYMVTANEIKDIIDNNKELLSEITNEQLKIITKMIDNGSELNDIKTALQYMGIKPTDSRLNKLINIGSSIIIEHDISKVLAKVFAITENKNCIKDLITRYNLNIKLNDITKIY